MNQRTADPTLSQLLPSDANTIRRLAAECDELRRDYADLAALDPDGLRAKVVVLAQENATERARADGASADAVKAWDEASALAAKVRTLEFAANPAVVASDMKMLREERDAFAANLRLARADVERLAGASVAELLTERRREIRDLTARLNDALAVQDVRDAELARWKATTAFTIDPPHDEVDRAFRAEHNARHEGEDEGSIGEAIGREGATAAECIVMVGTMVPRAEAYGAIAHAAVGHDDGPVDAVVAACTEIPFLRMERDAARAECERLRDALDDAENRVENLEIARTIGPRFDEAVRAVERERCAALCDAAAARWMTLAPGETATRGIRHERGNEAAALASEIRALRGAP